MSVRTRLRHWLGWHRRRLLRPRAAATAAPLESAAATAATAATGAPAAEKAGTLRGSVLA